MLADFIHVCKRNDPDLDNCIIKSVESLRPRLIKGIPELEVPAIEPLRVPELYVAKGAGFEAKGIDIDVGGPGNFKINKLKCTVDDDNLEVKIGVDLPFLTFNGQYVISGRILLLPISGKGPVHANATDCKGDVMLKAQIVKKKDGRYIYFHAMDIDIDIGSYKVRLDNLFNGDKILGETTNAALNENPKEFISYLKPIIEKTVGNVILEISNKIISHFEYDDVLPPN